MSSIISVINNKGGVAKTTSVVNLASALSKLNKKILIIDLDPQASLTTYLGLDPVSLENTIYNVLTSKTNIKESILVTYDENIHIVPSSIDLSAAEVEIISKIGREFIFKNKLEEVKDFYDYILIDNSPSLGILTVNSMIASDYIIAPVEPSYLALKGLDILISAITEVQSLNTNLKLMGVLVTMYDSRTTHHQEVLDLLQNKYRVFDSIIKRSIRFSDACLAMQSVIDFAGEKFDGSQAYLDLAREVVDYVQES